jgi:quinol monooxygenase YgiN
MSTHVVNEFFAQPGRGEDVANLLIEILGESLQWEGCEAIRIVRDQDNRDHVAGFTQWTQRRDFESYLAWRTARGFTATFEAMLTQPFVIHYYDELYFGPDPETGPKSRERSRGATGRPAADR